MTNFKVIEWKRKNSKNHVFEGHIHTKDDQDAVKIRLRCHRWSNGCKGTAYCKGAVYN